MWYHKEPFQFLIIRHAHRSDIPKGQFGNELPLTDEGKRTSESLGEELKHIKWAAIHTSPLLRCTQTADHFKEGTNQQIPIIPSKVLGDPGPFIADPEKAGPLFLENTLDQIKIRLVRSERLPGFHSLEEGVHLFMAHLKTIRSYPCLLISHDLIISLLCSYFLKIDTPFPAFLDGFCISNQKNLKTFP